MKYKIGDKVKVKSLEFFKDLGIYEKREVRNNTYSFFAYSMLPFCGKNLKITKVILLNKNNMEKTLYKENGYYKVEECIWSFQDWMLEGIKEIFC